jgi:sulfane dehydrogenase subunit SoxC
MPPSEDRRFTDDDIRSALRNREMPLEALRYDITPTGLHYLLDHFDIPALDPGSWRLEIRGLVARPRTFTLDELRQMPTVSSAVTIECAGNGRALMDPFPGGQPWRSGAVSTAVWAGVPLAHLLELTGVRPDAVEMVFSGADRGIEDGVEQRFERSLPTEDAMAPDVLVAYEMNGEPLPPQHGSPARLLVPGWYGMASVKWLVEIDAVATPFDGFQQWSYEVRQDEEGAGERITRMLPRALMQPPGIPDDVGRVVRGTSLEVRGRAWSGTSRIVRVEISSDDGRTWLDAEVDDPVGPRAWSAWSGVMDFARPGGYVLRSRATDADGRVQPVEPLWNVWGYQNNVCERVPVLVESASSARARPG